MPRFQVTIDLTADLEAVELRSVIRDALLLLAKKPQECVVTIRRVPEEGEP